MRVRGRALRPPLFLCQLLQNALSMPCVPGTNFDSIEGVCLTINQTHTHTNTTHTSTESTKWRSHTLLVQARTDPRAAPPDRHPFIGDGDAQVLHTYVLFCY